SFMDIISSGMRDLDLLLGGGFIRDSPVLLLTETGTMGVLLPLQVLNYRIREGDCGVIFDLDFPPIRIREWSKSFNWNLEKFEEEERLIIVDGFTNLYEQLSTNEKYVVENPRDLVHLDSYFHNLRPIIAKYRGRLFCVLFMSNVFLTKGQQIDKIVNLVYKNRITLSQFGTSVFVFDKGMMDEKTLSTLEHAFDYVVELRVVEQDKRFQKYLRVVKSPLISYVSDLVPYEVAPSGVSLRTEIIKEFENMKLNIKMLENGTIDFLGLRMIIFPAEVFSLLAKSLLDKYGYEAGYSLIRSLGKEVAHVLFEGFTKMFKVTTLEEAVHFYARIGTLMGFGDVTVLEYNMERGVLRFRIINSSICALLKNLGKNTGAFQEGVIERTAEIFIGPKSKCEEVKCVAKGDECCEYLVTFLPETILDRKVE
ncbi:MAG: ATPase domain-containing protein, partial [Candidatus Jordarchaeaceae archaeon]